MRNLLSQLRDILGTPSLQVGSVVSESDGSVVVQLPGGGLLSCRGSGTVGSNVYVRDGVVEGPAPDLPTYTIDI